VLLVFWKDDIKSKEFCIVGLRAKVTCCVGDSGEGVSALVLPRFLRRPCAGGKGCGNASYLLRRKEHYGAFQGFVVKAAYSYYDGQPLAISQASTK
jgi:hypothetical protein